MSHHSMSPEVGHLVEINPAKYKAVLQLLKIILSRHEPQDVLSILTIAIVDQIDLAIQKEMQLEVAKGTALSIVANIQRSSQDVRYYPRILKKLEQLAIPSAVAREVIADAKAGKQMALDLIKSARKIRTP